jgi:hypothetical protein
VLCLLTDGSGIAGREERFDELVCLEGPQVVEPLAYPDEA